MGVCLEVQFAPLELKGSASPLRSWTSLRSSVDIRVMLASVSRKTLTPEVSFDDDGEVKLSSYTFLNNIA